MSISPPPTRPGSALVVCCLGFLAISALTGCGDPPPPPAPPPPEVQVVDALQETISIKREYVGTASAFRSVQVRARVEGILLRRHFAEGTAVRKGELLFTIDAAPYEAALRDARAELARAEANLANARAREARYAPLVAEDAISKQDFDDTVSQRKQAEALVNAALANVDRAQMNVGYTKIHAEESGRIGAALVPEGALVGRGEPTLLAVIDKLDPIHATFTISDRDAIVLQRAFASGEIVDSDSGGPTARVLLPDGSEFPNPGSIDFTDAQVNPDTGTLSIRAVMPNAEPKLLPGMFVRVEVTIGERPNTILVPQQAVVKVPTGHVVWVVRDDGTVERRDLVVGEWFGDQWIVEKGVVAGEKIVVTNIQKLQPGIPVRAVAAGASAAPSAPPAAPREG